MPVRRALDGLALAALLLLAALFAFHRVESADLPWQLAAGREILESGRIPRSDPWAAMSRGREWLDVHWLAQLGMALVERAGGWVALQAAAVLAVVAALALALVAARAPARGAAWPVALLALVAAHQRLEPRPDLAALVLPPAFLLLLDRTAEGGSRRARRAALGAVLLLQALWTNLHGSFVLGPLLAAAYALGLALEPAGRARGLPPLLAALAATLANPRGPGVWGLFRPYVEAVAARLAGARGAPAPRIQEWIPPLAGEAAPYLQGVLPSYLLLLALSVTGLVVAGARLRLPRALALVLMALLSLVALRNLAPFALVAAAALPPFLAAGIERLAPRPQRLLAAALPAATAALAGGLAAQVATNRFFASRLLPTETGPGRAAVAYPAAACGWVEAARLEGQAFHNYEVGGYWLWRFDRRRPPLLDGRLDLLAPDALRRYEQAVADPAAFERLVAEHGVTHVVLKYATADAAVLFPYLERARGRWRRAFADAAGAVYLPAEAAIPPVEPAPEPEHPWDRRARELWAPLARRQAHLPAATLNLAMLAEASGDLRGAAGHYERALEELPGIPRWHARAALLHARTGERERARLHLAWLEEHAPRDAAVAPLRALLRE